MTPVASVSVPGGRVDVGRQDGAVLLRVLSHEGEGVSFLARPEQARRLALALLSEAGRAAVYAAPELVAPEPPEAA